MRTAGGDARPTGTPGPQGRDAGAAEAGSLIAVGLRLARPELTSHQVAELVYREHEEARLREIVDGHHWR